MTKRRKKTVKIPRYIQMLGVQVQIIEDTNMEDSDWGETHLEKRLIRLNPKYRDYYPDTLLHEMIHMALGLSGQSELLKAEHEEGIVRALEHALIPFFKI